MGCFSAHTQIRNTKFGYCISELINYSQTTPITFIMTFIYPSIPSTSRLAYDVLESSTDSLLVELRSATPPKPGSKSIFGFWHTGIDTLPPYLLRNVLNWHRRFSPLGWTIYILDTVPDSPLNVSNFIDTTSPAVVPEAFTKRTLSGSYAAQHTSDLTRYPLLLRYGGVYLDVGILQFGDLNWLWNEHISNPASPYDFAGFTMGDPPSGISIVNFGLVSGPNNTLIGRAHHILLRLWEGKTDTIGMCRHPLVDHLPLMHVPQEVAVEDDAQGNMVINDEAMTDYAIQIQCMGSAQRWHDGEDDWNGPKYVREHCWLYSMMNGAFLHEQMTNWNSACQFELLKLQLPQHGEKETEKQMIARMMVEKVAGETWLMKLGHGFSAKLFGADTLGMLWREHVGSDCEEGTYAGWLRWAEVHCVQNDPPKPLEIPVYEPTMRESFHDV
jgi:hypothetical protein